MFGRFSSKIPEIFRRRIEEHCRPLIRNRVERSLVEDADVPARMSEVSGAAPIYRDPFHETGTIKRPKVTLNREREREEKTTTE